MDGLSSYLDDAASASSTLEFAGVNGAKAERVIATMWRILEAHSLATPIVQVNSANGLFDISLTFGSAKECALVENSLPNNTH